MKTCIYCSAEFSPERPHDHCTNQTCVETWLLQRRGDMSIVLLPKQGFTYQYRDKMAGASGRSSGR